MRQGLQEIMQTRAINVTTPDGTCGPWSISTFTISKEEAERYNFATIAQGMPGYFQVAPGTYKRLMHSERGVVMSNTPMEVFTNLPFLIAASGDVLIHGLGLGMVLHVLLDDPRVTSVTMVELDQDVIALTAPHFRDHIASGRLRLLHGNCYTRKLSKDEQYDIVWHDIWDTISDENLEDMKRLRSRYSRRSKVQLCWAESDCQSMRDGMIRMLRANGRTWSDFKKYLKEKEMNA